MRFSSLTPMLRTPDLPGTIEFYVQVLGFTCSNRMDAWAHLNRDSVQIMLSGPNEHEGDTEPGFTGSLYIRTDDVDAVWKAVAGRARICYPIEDFDYGQREFGIYDNNGYLVQFGQGR